MNTEEQCVWRLRGKREQGTFRDFRKFSKDRSVGTGKVCGWGGGRGKLVKGLVDIELYPKDNEVQLEELESGGSRT